MAIKYKELNAKLEDPQLKDEELKLIDKTESWIDDDISKNFRGGEVLIPYKLHVLPGIL